jgi:hypothetical protein
MIFVLKYGGADLMYLGLTLVVPLGHLAFSFHSDFSTTSIYDVLGLAVLVAGLFLFRFGYSNTESRERRNTNSDDDDHHHYVPLNGEEDEEGADAGPREADGEASLATTITNKEGFLEFLREPFMLVGDI